jgi:hypothetical protein
MKAMLGLGLFLAVSVVSAQFDGTMLDMAYGPFSMLQRPEIRKELKLSKDQIKQADLIIKELSKATESGNAVVTSLKKIDDDLMALLDEKQKERFFQIQIQAKGGTALSDPIVAVKIEMSVEQISSVKKIRKAAQNKLLDELRKGSRDSKLMENISKAEEKELLAVLSEGQREAFGKLAGEIFKGARMKGMWPI